MSVRDFKNTSPRVHASVYVDPQACLIGDVEVGADSSIWPMAVLRGDVNRIRVGARTSVQDGTVIHVTHPYPARPGGTPCRSATRSPLVTAWCCTAAPLAIAA